jgi:hypothetical protein
MSLARVSPSVIQTGQAPATRPLAVTHPQDRAPPAELARPPARHRRPAARRAPAGRSTERAQLVWRRALQLAGPPAQHDRFRFALDLLRAAHHSPATMAHALNLGRTQLHALPDDDRALGGIAVLEEAIAFLGIKPQADSIAGAGR